VGRYYSVIGDDVLCDGEKVATLKENATYGAKQDFIEKVENKYKSECKGCE